MTPPLPPRLTFALRRLAGYVLPFALLMFFLAIGEALRTTFHTWIPGSVIGMLLLMLALSTGLVKAAFLENLSDVLLDRLGLFFVCPGVEVIKYLGLVESHGLSLALAIVGSSIVTIVVTGWAGEWVARTATKGRKNTQDMRG